MAPLTILKIIRTEALFKVHIIWEGHKILTEYMTFNNKNFLFCPFLYSEKYWQKLKKLRNTKDRCAECWWLNFWYYWSPRFDNSAVPGFSFGRASARCDRENGSKSMEIKMQLQIKNVHVVAYAALCCSDRDRVI